MKNYKLILILSVCIIVPFSNDIFLAALPKIATVFHTQHTGLILSFALFGLALAQSFYGPLLDRFGRKPILIVGLIIFSSASLLILFSQHFYVLLVGRFFQAIGACSAIVTTLAIARDVYTQEKLVIATSTIMAIIGICPALAPIFGSVLTEWLGWQGSFFFLLCLGIFYLLIATTVLHETIVEKNYSALKFKQIIANYQALLKNKTYFKSCFISACSYGALFSFFSLAPILIIQKWRFSLMAFGLILGCNAISIFIISVFAPRIAKKIGLDGLLTNGTCLILAGGLLMLVLNLLITANIFTFMIPMLIATLGIGLIRPSASAVALSSSPKNLAGSASAGFNFMSFLGGTMTTSIIGSLVVTTLNFAILLCGLAMLAFIASYLNRVN